MLYHFSNTLGEIYLRCYVFFLRVLIKLSATARDNSCFFCCTRNYIKLHFLWKIWAFKNILYVLVSLIYIILYLKHILQFTVRQIYNYHQIKPTFISFDYRLHHTPNSHCIACNQALFKMIKTYFVNCIRFMIRFVLNVLHNKI